MTKVFFIGLFFIIQAMAFAASTANEKLEYDLKWMGIKAGTAVLETVSEKGGNIKISSTARSVRWISVFYPVDDRVESLFENRPDGAFPIRFFKKLSEGSFRRHREFIFDNKGKVLYIDHLKKEKFEMDVPERVFDPFSAFYSVRCGNLNKTGESVFIPVFDDKKLYDVEVKILGREKVETPFGEKDAIIIKPLLKTEGIFSRKGDIIIWLTDDEDKIPVILKSEVVFGGITAVLRKRENSETSK